MQQVTLIIRGKLGWVRISSLSVRINQFGRYGFGRSAKSDSLNYNPKQSITFNSGWQFIKCRYILAHWCFLRSLTLLIIMYIPRILVLINKQLSIVYKNHIVRMNKLILVLALVIFSFTNGQELNLNITKSRLFKEPITNSVLIKSFPGKQNTIWTVRHYDERMNNSGEAPSTGFIVQQWDSLLNSLSYKNYRIQIEKKSHLSEIFLNNGKINIVEYATNKKNRTIDCFIHTPSDNNNQLIKKKLFSFDSKRFPGFLAVEFSGRLDSNYSGDVEFSPNKDFIAFHIDSYKGEDEKHKLFVFNNKLEEVWSREFTHPKEDKSFILQDLKVSNFGDIFLLAKIFEDGNRLKRKGAINYHFELFKVGSDNTENVSLGTKDNYIRQLDLKINGDRIDCIGFYSEESENKLKGTAFFLINSLSLEVSNAVFQQFDTDFLADKYGQNEYKELSNYSVKNIEHSGDGGYILTAEEYYVDQTFHTTGMVSITYHYDDVVILKLSGEGKLIWARNINKKQSASYNNRALSYSSFTKNGETYIFLNAHKKMGELTGKRQIFKSGFFGDITKANSNLYAIKLNKDGAWNKTVIQNNKDSELIFDLQNGWGLNNTNIILFGSDDKNKQFLSIGSK